MIFCTVGTQAPFDRLIKIVDEIAAEIDEEIVAQVYRTNYVPKNIKTVDFLSPDEFNRYLSSARLIVAHAGMGSIISAMHHRKPIVVFPRIAKLGEHRNEHQMATAKKMEELGYVYVAYEGSQLKNFVLSDLKSLKELGAYASASLIEEIRKQITAAH